MASNEAYFRDVNERIEEQVKEVAGEDATFNVLCECASMRCAQRIVVTSAEYATVREDPRQFIVAPGHPEPEIEDTVLQTDRFVIVRKRGEAGRAAEEAAAE
jgi:hypothetical protein